MSSRSRKKPRKTRKPKYYKCSLSFVIPAGEEVKYLEDDLNSLAENMVVEGGIYDIRAKVVPTRKPADAIEEF